MSQNQRSSTGPTIILGLLFFLFGFVTWLNGTLIPYLKMACELSTFQSMLVASAFYISYFVMALPSARILEKTGLKKGMMVGLLVMTCGAVIFIPAAMTRSYPLFLSGLFIIGTGLSLLQTASNPYAAILGPIESAARRISIMGICNKLAGAIGLYVIASIILHDADTLSKKLATADASARTAMLDELASRVIMPYVVMAVILVAMAFIIYFSSLPEIEMEREEDMHHGPDSRSSVLQFPNLVLGAIAIFVYVGAEVMAGDTISTYGQAIGIPLSEAKIFTAYTLFAMIAGYIFGIFTIPRYISQSKALVYSAVTGIVISLLVLLTSGFTSVMFVALLGLANALMWPAIWPLAIHGLGKFTKTGSALLIMGIVGGAFFPPLYGKLAQLPEIGPRLAYLLFFPAYLFILYYALRGHKIRRW